MRYLDGVLLCEFHLDNDKCLDEWLSLGLEW